jgi:hypothetical protein
MWRSHAGRTGERADQHRLICRGGGFRIQAVPHRHPDNNQSSPLIRFQQRRQFIIGDELRCRKAGGDEKHGCLGYGLLNFPPPIPACPDASVSLDVEV